MASKQTLEEQLGLANFGEAPPLKVALLIRDCMKAQGFEYVPVDPAAQRAAGGANALSDAEFQKLYGYGISTLYGHPQPTVPDPNQTIRDGLSPADRTAYDKALTGGDPNNAGDFSTVGGCTKQATDKVYGGAETLNALVAKLDELAARVDNDQRIVQATQRWSQCMQKAGYQFSRPKDIKPWLSKQLQGIVGAATAPSGEGGPPSTAAGAVAPSYDQAALARLQQEEMSISTADLACRAQGLDKVKADVQAEYEAVFRTQNATLLAKVPATKG